jgi:hypothetical protein
MLVENPYDYADLTRDERFPGRRRDDDEERDVHESEEADCRRKERGEDES